MTEVFQISRFDLLCEHANMQRAQMAECTDGRMQRMQRIDEGKGEETEACIKRKPKGKRRGQRTCCLELFRIRSCSDVCGFVLETWL